jgi:hypothetical protein
MMNVSKRGHWRYLCLALGYLAASIGAHAASVRAVFFDYNRSNLTLTFTPTTGEATNLEIEAHSLGKPTQIAPGAYNVTCPDFKAPVKFTMPDAAPKYILVLIEITEGNWKLLPIVDNRNDFSLGKYMIINATPATVAVRLHNQKVKLDPLKSHCFNKVEGNFKHNQFEVELGTLIEGQLKPFRSTYWPVLPKLRVMVMIYPDKKGGRFQTSSVADMDREEEPEAP